MLPGQSEAPCPQCGKLFNVSRGAVSRRIEGLMVCNLCGQQEAIEIL